MLQNPDQCLYRCHSGLWWKMDMYTIGVMDLYIVLDTCFGFIYIYRNKAPGLVVIPVLILPVVKLPFWYVVLQAKRLVGHLATMA